MALSQPESLLLKVHRGRFNVCPILRIMKLKSVPSNLGPMVRYMSPILFVFHVLQRQSIRSTQITSTYLESWGMVIEGACC
jgi:hypothetical protein